MAETVRMIANVRTKAGTDISEKKKEAPFTINQDMGPSLAQKLQKELESHLAISDAKQVECLSGISGSQKALAAAALLQTWEQAVIIVPDQKDIFRWEEDLAFFAPDISILSFPVVEEADVEVTFTSTERLRERMRTLGALLSGKPLVVLATSVEAAQKIVSPADLLDGALSIHMGQEIEREAFLEKLVSLHYERVDQVERCGHFAVRGDIIDIFPINEEHPVRIEFFGDEVDSLRLFDEDTQRSISEKEEETVFPLFVKAEKKSVLSSYMKRGLLLYDEPQREEEGLRKYFKEEKANRDKAFTWGETIRLGRKAGHKELAMVLLKRKLTGFTFDTDYSWNGITMTNYQRQIPIFIEDTRHMLERGWTGLLLTPRPSERKEIEAILGEYHIPCSETPKAGTVTLINGLLSGGFELPDDKLSVMTAGDVLGRQKVRRIKGVSKGKQIRYFSDLNPGDYVVQQSHGVGKYIGIQTIELSGIHRDYITIQYAGSDKLYLPMEQITTLEKYIGPEGETPKLNAMGGAGWTKARAKAKKSIEELAERLLEVYAKREITKGISFEPDTAEQREFEDTFPYVETEDQMTAIDAIKKAMEKPIPMDMLLCGDVGFGKTEVAMRAVFKCVMSGYQAMVLCPTTVLSEQHYKNFKDRMDHFGVQMAVLNRFTSLKERKDILAKLASGELDVIIGTHAVLNKKVKAKRLGLLVVDEEQRFGVVQKEKWKSWSAGIDVLNLSATPIPRTLHMSLTGVRDMVTITTPPSNRHAIQTYVTEYDDGIVKDAILREKERGGQVFFVYNRIETIGAMADHLKSILPEDITIGIAYGRMEGRQLEKVMMDFYEGKYDVLLCTTLIENGLDQPNANTMLVYDADRMGLSQIYQMRGRVGRSEKIARAWFFYRKGKVLSEVAEKRLDTIREFTELGSGFKVAMRDLEIRGAGNLLGSAQHGNIASIGFATYCSMLEEAVERLRAIREHRPVPKKLPNTTIEFRQDAYLDAGYIKNEEQKMEIYRRLAAVEDEKALDDLIDEVVDRFGTPTVPAEKLFHISKIRVKAKQLGIGSLLDEGNSFLITWADESFMRGWNPMNLPKSWIPYLKFLPGSPTKLRIRKEIAQGDMMKWMAGFVDELLKEVRGK